MFGWFEKNKNECDKYLDFSKPIIFRNRNIGQIESIVLPKSKDYPPYPVDKLGVRIIGTHPFTIYFFNKCGHYDFEHIDGPLDLINDFDQEKKQMKHPCGKVFDVSKRFICEDGDEIENFIVGNNKISVKFKNDNRIIDYKLCGHNFDYKIAGRNIYIPIPDSCVTDLYNLINIDQPIDWNKPICVVNEVSGKEYKANVEDIFLEFVEVLIEFELKNAFKECHSYCSYQFSLDGKDSNLNTPFMKLVAKNL